MGPGLAAALARGHEEGTPEGVAELYDTYADELFAYLRTLTGDDRIAGELLHDTVVVVRSRARGLGGSAGAGGAGASGGGRGPGRTAGGPEGVGGRAAGRGDGTLRALLYAVARSEAARHGGVAVGAAASDGFGAASATGAPARPDARAAEFGQVWRPGVVDLGAVRDRARLLPLVPTALKGVEPAEREALELTVRHGLDAAELGRVLELSERQAVRLVARGRTQFAECLVVHAVCVHPDQECAELAVLLPSGVVSGAALPGPIEPELRVPARLHVESCGACRPFIPEGLREDGARYTGPRAESRAHGAVAPDAGAVHVGATELGRGAGGPARDRQTGTTATTHSGTTAPPHPDRESAAAVTAERRPDETGTRRTYPRSPGEQSPFSAGPGVPPGFRARGVDASGAQAPGGSARRSGTAGAEDPSAESARRGDGRAAGRHSAEGGSAHHGSRGPGGESAWQGAGAGSAARRTRPDSALNLGDAATEGAARGRSLGGAPDLSSATRRSTVPGPRRRAKASREATQPLAPTVVFGQVEATAESGSPGLAATVDALLGTGPARPAPLAVRAELLRTTSHGARAAHGLVVARAVRAGRDGFPRTKKRRIRTPLATTAAAAAAAVLLGVALTTGGDAHPSTQADAPVALATHTGAESTEPTPGPGVAGAGGPGAGVELPPPARDDGAAAATTQPPSPSSTPSPTARPSDRTTAGATKGSGNGNGKPGGDARIAGAMDGADTGGGNGPRVLTPSVVLTAGNPVGTLRLSAADAPVNWTLGVSGAPWVSLSRTSGTLRAGATVSVTVAWDTARAPAGGPVTVTIAVGPGGQTITVTGPGRSSGPR
ncbi:hypothetical protein [Yinghuangia seranimata]|uniref:hypothetical protein n=1 Tax=Yinghuangia seranimata TaxID=408067 RepID=UPI00248C3031|nr:hypothetical protein [Yinghuangia seranimata]MDI2132621.1 hypothetical protein [Yinghuangia seranimata]